MSLAIDVQRITAVLLSDGHWYDVDPGSFNTDAYEFFHGDFYKESDYSVTPPLWANPPCSTGFEFKRSTYGGGSIRPQILSGPMTSIIAVRY